MPSLRRQTCTRDGGGVELRVAEDQSSCRGRGQRTLETWNGGGVGPKRPGEAGGCRSAFISGGPESERDVVQRSRPVTGHSMLETGVYCVLCKACNYRGLTIALRKTAFWMPSPHAPYFFVREEEHQLANRVCGAGLWSRGPGTGWRRG